MTDIEDTSGAAPSGEPIDAEFEPVKNTDDIQYVKKGLGWFGALCLALFSGVVGAVGNQFLVQSSNFSNALGSYSRPQKPVQSDPNILERLNDITQIKTELESAKEQLIALKEEGLAALNVESLEPRIKAAVDEALLELNAPLENGIARLESELDKTQIEIAKSVGRLDIISDLIAPVADIQKRIPSGVLGTDTSQTTTDKTGIVAQTSTPDEASAPATNTPILGPVDATDNAPSPPPPATTKDNDAISALEKIANLQKRAQATVILARMEGGLSKVDVFGSARAQVAAINLEAPELSRLLEASETKPLDNAGLAAIIESQKNKYIEVNAAETRNNATPAWLEGFVTVKRKDAEKDADLGHFDTLMTLTNIGQISEAALYFDGLSRADRAIFGDYGKALGARVRYEQALKSAQIALASEVK